MHGIQRILAAAFIIVSVSAGTLEIKGSGATFPAPLYFGWIQSFEEANPDIQIDYAAVGSGQGIKDFVAGDVHFGASDAAMSDDEIAQVDGAVSIIPATAGSIVLAYNIPGLTETLRLSRDALIGIFSGEITQWDDDRIASVNPDANLPARSIALVARRDSSGTTFAFTNHLAAIDVEWNRGGASVGKLIRWPGRTMIARGNDGVAGRIRVSAYAIGYVEYGFAERLGLPVAAIENKAGNFILPGPETSSAALEGSVGEMPADGRQFLTDPSGTDAYPIVTYSWLLLRNGYSEAGVSNAVKAFVRWGLDQGQGVAKDLGYVPLPASVVARSKELLGNVE